VLVGGAGTDTITGGEGKDVITGGAGDDQIIMTETTAARDIVVFEASATENGADTITDFAAGAATTSDVLDVSAFLGADVVFEKVADGATVNTSDLNVLVFETAGDITAATTTWAANQSAVVVNGADVSFVTTNALAEVTITGVATLTGVDAYADLVAGNFA